jgi:hypothetical protein
VVQCQLEPDVKLSDLSISTRFIILLCGIVAVTAFSARSFYVRQERADLQLRLQEKAAFINKAYAFLISGALARNDDIGLLQIVNSLEDEKEITSVIVVDQKNEIRYHADPDKTGRILEDPLVKQALETGQASMHTFTNAGGPALALICPLKSPESSQPMGVVRIDLTYRQIDQQVNASKQHYWIIMVGSLITSAGLVMMFVGKWILTPLTQMRSAMGTIQTSSPEPTLAETPDEIGQTSKAINELMVRFKTEWQQQWGQQHQRSEQEKAWIQQLTRSFLPDARLMIADKDNRVLSDTGNGAGSKTVKSHLMDLIKDANFSNLLTTAFHKEGEVVRGSVSFENKNYLASIISVPLQQSLVVKTLIALQPY